MPAEKERGNAPPPRRRKRYVLAAVPLLIALVAPFLIYRRLTNPARIREAVMAMLTERTGGVVSLGSAAFSWSDGIRLDHLQLTGPSGSPGAETPHGHPIANSIHLECPEIILHCRPLSLLLGKPEITSIIVREPILTMTLDSSGDGFALLADWLRMLRPVERRKFVPPPIDVRKVRVRVVHVDGGISRVVDDVVATVRGHASKAHPEIYELVWEEGESGPGGQARIDLTSGAETQIQGGLPWVSVATLRLFVEHFLPSAAAQLDSLHLRGHVRLREMNGSDGPTGERRAAVFDVRDLSLSIPCDDAERSLSERDRFLRFTQAGGEIRWDSTGVSVQLRGALRGAPCELTGRIDGPLRDEVEWGYAASNFSLAVRGIELPRTGPEASPEESRLVAAWQPLKSTIRDYDPHGPVDVSLSLAKAVGNREPIRLRRMELTARGGDASCRLFPYRVRDLTGSVVFDAGGLALQKLCGTHGGGLVCVDGTVASMERGSAYTIRAVGTGLLIDDDLCQEMAPAHQDLRRRFDPRGRVDVAALIQREASEGGAPPRARSRFDVTFDDLIATYVDMPLPVHSLKGKLSVEYDRSFQVDVQGFMHDARVEVQGQVVYRGDSPADLDLRLTAENVRYDSRHQAALPPTLRAVLDRFSPAGLLDLRSTLAVNPENNRLTHETVLTLKGMTVRPEQFPVPFESVQGLVRINHEEVVLDAVTGRHGETTVTLHGVTSLQDGPTNLTVTCHPLALDEELRAALPAHLQNGLQNWQIDGPLFSETRLSRPAANAPSMIVDTTVHFEGARLRHSSFPLPFENVHGEVRIDSSNLSSEHLAASYGTGTVSAEVQAAWTPQSRKATLVLSAKGLTLDEMPRNLLPTSVRLAWDRSEPSGRVHLSLDRLEYDSQTDRASPSLWVTGSLQLENAAFTGMLGGRVEKATIAGQGYWVDSAGDFHLSGTFEAAKAEWLGEGLNDLKAEWTCARAAGDAGSVTIDNLEARLSDGQVAGRAHLSLEQGKTNYDLEAMLHEVRLESLLESSVRDRSRREDTLDVTGLVDARLRLSGTMGDDSTRSGLGRLSIAEARLFRTPFILAILNVLNLSLPDEAFDEVHADFYVDGNRVDFTDLQLHSKGLALIGSGSMFLPEWTVDLRLLRADPRWWMTVPMVTDLLQRTARELVELHVTGPLSGPVVRARPLRALSDEIKSLLQKRKPKTLQPIGP